MSSCGVMVGMDLRDSPQRPQGGETQAESRMRERELAWVAGVANGDVNSFQEVYKQQSPGVYALCIRMMRDTQRAEEVMQDTFWQLWTKPGQFDPKRGRLSTFLYQVARSRCLDRLRAERSQTERIRAAHGEVELDSPERSGPTPLHLAVKAQDRLQVRRALDGLSPDLRSAVILTYFDGLSQSEIAERLDAPVGTVKTWIRRGLLQMKKSLRSAGAA